MEAPAAQTVLTLSRSKSAWGVLLLVIFHGVFHG